MRPGQLTGHVASSVQTQSPTIIFDEFHHNNPPSKLAGLFVLKSQLRSLNTLVKPRLKTSSLLWCSYSNVLRILASLTAGISSFSRLLYHWSRAWASIRPSIPGLFIRSCHIPRSMLQVMTFIDVSVFSISQQPQRKSCFMALSRAVFPPMLPSASRYHRLADKLFNPCQRSITSEDNTFNAGGANHVCVSG